MRDEDEADEAAAEREDDASSSSHGRVRFLGRTEPAEGLLYAYVDVREVDGPANEDDDDDEAVADEGGGARRKSGARGSLVPPGDSFANTGFPCFFVCCALPPVPAPLAVLTEAPPLPKMAAVALGCLARGAFAAATATAVVLRCLGGVGGHSSDPRTKSGRVFSPSPSLSESQLRLGCDESMRGLDMARECAQSQTSTHESRASE